MLLGQLAGEPWDWLFDWGGKGRRRGGESLVQYTKRAQNFMVQCSNRLLTVNVSIVP